MFYLEQFIPLMHTMRPHRNKIRNIQNSCSQNPNGNLEVKNRQKIVI